MIVFTSGSCRIGFPLTRLHFEGKIQLINPHWDANHPAHQIGDVAPMALGHFHSITDHLNLFKLLYDDSDKTELKNALFMICDRRRERYREDWESAWNHCKSMWPLCEAVVIEICSYDPHQRGLKKVDDEEIKTLMKDIEKMLVGKKVLWVNHFRPSIVWPNGNQRWRQIRESLFEVVSTRTNFLDPSTYIKEDWLRDQDHYNPEGVRKIAEIFWQKIQSLR